MKRKNSFSKTVQESVDDYKKKLDLGRNFVDYFLTVGLEPKIALNPWLYENSIEELNATYKEYLSPKIINKFPSFDKKLIGIDEIIIQHIFPLGFQIKEILNFQPKEQFFFIILENNMYSNKHPHKFVSCLLFYEPLSNYYKIFEKYNDINARTSNNNNINKSKYHSNSNLINISTYLDNSSNNNALYNLNDNMSTLSANTIAVSVNNVNNNSLNIHNNNSDIRSTIKPIMQTSNLRISDFSQKETNISSVLPSINNIINNNSNIKKKNFENYYVPKCICLISLSPFINEYKTILMKLYNYSKSKNSEIPLEKIINNLILEVPVPPRGKYSIEYSILGTEIILQSSYMNSLFYANYNFEILFVKFNNHQILQIFRYLMLGISTIFFSSDIQLLSPIIFSSLILLFPFKFPFPMTSVLPKDSYNYINNPLPVLFGINEKYDNNFFEVNDIPIDNDLLVVDIDENRVIPLPYLENRKNNSSSIPSLPKKLSNELLKKLSNYYEKITANIKNGIQEPNDSFQKTIRNYFLQFQTELLKDYPKYLNTNIYKHQSEKAFKEKQFLKTINSEDFEFYEKFIKGQMFVDYINKRMMPNDKKEMKEVLFFEEKIFELKGQKDKIIYINSNIFEYKNKYEVAKVNKNLKEDILNYYLNEQIQKKLLIDGIVINNNTNINDISFLNKTNNSLLDSNIKNNCNNRSILFNYILFPKLNNNFYFESEIKSYYLNLSLYEEIRNLNTELILRSHLSRVETPTNEITNYIYLLWLKIWANSFHYHDRIEHKYRYIQMMKIFKKVSQHDMSVLSHLFQALIKSKADEDLVYHLYNTFIKYNLSPSLEIFNTVKNMIRKKLKGGGMPSSDNISKFLENKTKIKFTKDEVDIKNFRSRTMKTIYDVYTITEKITFIKDEECGTCHSKINMFNFIQNLNDTTNDNFWAKCPFCKNSYLPKIKIIFGSEINKNNKLKTSTSIVDDVFLFSPKTLQTDFLDYSDIDIDKFKLNNNTTFWNLILYFKLNHLPYDFFLPYTEHIFRPQKNKNHNYYDVNYTDTYDFDVNNKKEITPNQIKIQKIEENNKNSQIILSNNIKPIPEDNIINNINNINHYNTIVHKINNKQNTIQINQSNDLKSVRLQNKTIKLNSQIINNRIQNPNLNTINYTNTHQPIPQFRVKQQIRPVQRLQKHLSYSTINNKILIPVNKNSSLNSIQPQITNIPITNYYNYYPQKYITQTNYTNNPNYVMNNSISYNNNMQNFGIVNNNMNNRNYISQLQNRMILQKPVVYKTFIRYNK